ncbi:MAG: hypothetical protein WD995_09615 [Gemmatimonadota bacterium]
MKRRLASIGVAALLVMSTADPVQAQAEPSELATDSIVGTLVERIPDGLVIRTDDGVHMALEILSDTVQQRGELDPDSASTPIPHGSVMSRDDILFAVRQLEESDERQRMHIHYVTLPDDPARRVIVWLSIARDRLPGA